MARRGQEDGGRAWSGLGSVLTIGCLIALYLLPLLLSWIDGELFPGLGFNRWIGSHPRLRHVLEQTYAPLAALFELWRDR